MNAAITSSSKMALVCGATVFVVALLLYWWTLAPTVTLVDSGELILAADRLGVAHPPGFPLWVMLAHLATLVPWGNVAVRVNFSSALFGALASATLALVVVELMITSSNVDPTDRKEDGAKRSKTAAYAGNPFLIAVPAIGAGLLMAFSRTLWLYSTITEVYALNTLSILVIFFLMLRWRRWIMEDRQRAGAAFTPVVTSHDWLLYSAAFAFGLALGNHHVTIGLTLPAIAVIVYGTEGSRFFVSARLLYATLISVIGLVAVYGYLPLASSRSPIIDWGEPHSLQAIWWHITGRQYQVFLSFTPAMIGKLFGQFVTLLLREFGPPWLPAALLLAIVGFGRAFKVNRTAFWFLLVIILCGVAYNLSYEIDEDKDAYYLPVFAAVAMAAGLGMRWFIERLLSKHDTSKGRALTVVIVPLIALAVASIGNWPFNNRRDYLIAQDYAENILASIQPNGLLLTEDWQVASPMFYVQQVEHRRDDVKVVDVNLLRRLWYFSYLRQAYPDLIERSRAKIDAFVAELQQWERNPAAYAADRVATQRIYAAFLEMIQSMVTKESSLAPVYMTNDLISTDSINGEVTGWLKQTYQLVPQGLVFQLVSDHDFHDPAELHLQTRGLADGTLRFEKDDVVSEKVLPTYAAMLVNRGRYLLRFNQNERAIAAFREALALNPTFAPAQQGLALAGRVGRKN